MGQSDKPAGEGGKARYFWPTFIICLAGIYTAAYLVLGDPPETAALAGIAVVAGILAFIVAGVLRAMLEKRDGA